MAPLEVDDLKCVVCGLSQNSADNMTGQKLLVNKCGHKFCDRDARSLSNKKPIGTCPVCNEKVHRSSMSDKSIEEIETHKDARMRKKICRIFNKTREDFAEAKDYDDYLEKREDIIYNLVRDIDVDNMNALVAEYKANHQSEIARNQARAHDEEAAIAESLEAQRKKEETDRLYGSLEEQRAQRAKKMVRQQAIEVALGDRDRITATVEEEPEMAAQEALQGPLLPRRELLVIKAPLPTTQPHQQPRRELAQLSMVALKGLQRQAAAAVRDEDTRRRNVEEAMAGLMLREAPPREGDGTK